jgi:isopentenyl-diphosphate delta-isomerase
MKRVIVDKNDEIIGAKTRDELDFTKDIYRVSALWLMNSKGEVLIAQRGLKLNNAPGSWGPAVAGTVEEGETYEDNIYKESQEEIGLSGVKFKLGPKLFRRAERSYFCQFFTATIDKDDQDFKINSFEVERVEWIELDKLKKNIELYPEKYVGTMKLIIENFS